MREAGGVWAGGVAVALLGYPAAPHHRRYQAGNGPPQCDPRRALVIRAEFLLLYFRKTALVHQPSRFGMTPAGELRPGTVKSGGKVVNSVWPLAVSSALCSPCLLTLGGFAVGVLLLRASLRLAASRYVTFAVETYPAALYALARA